MSIASLANIEKTFGQRVLFDALSLTIYPGERIGLIGANGEGKTSLLKVLTGELIPDTGSVAIAGGVKVGYLRQDASFDPANTLVDEAELAYAELHALAHRLRDLEHAMADQTGDELTRTLGKYQTVQHEYDLAGGYAWHHRLEATLTGVGLDRATWEQNVQTLSGGQRSRLALAKLLISDPDLLLLDEPTNHLDLSGIGWLETYLLQFKGAVLLISHDRFLLDRLVTRVVWLSQCRLSSYPGNYSAFIKQRELAELTQERQYEQQQADIEKQKEFIRRFGAGQRSKEAKGREKRLNRLLASDQMVQAVRAQRAIRLPISTDLRAGDRVLDVSDLAKSYSTAPLWADLRLQVNRGERIGIIGPNGSGKTTLLRVLLGQEAADAGQVRWGASLSIGYYDQRVDDFDDPDHTVLEEVAEGREQIREQQLRDLLAMLLFRGNDIYKPLRLLSGGERARVRLAELLLDKPNVLVLDEPTNHLDIASCEALEAALGQFPGTILCVSHDRYFLDKIVGRMLVLNPPGVTDFAGNFSAWAEKQLRLEQQRAATVQPSRQTPARPQATSDTPRDNPYKRPFGRLSMEELERQITQTEVDLAECQQSFADPAAFRKPARQQRMRHEYDALSVRLQQLEQEYFARER
jgi:ATP-binding cassette subfamily F protein 3